MKNAEDINIYNNAIVYERKHGNNLKYIAYLQEKLRKLVKIKN